MNINRQYNLPNCTIKLEGYSSAISAQGDSRPLMTILTAAECYFVTQNQQLSGGKDLFESLVIAVSHYAQEYLSGIPQPETHQNQSVEVKLQKFNHLHRLTVRSPLGEGHQSAQSPIVNQIDLNTVQLCDLVDAIDQFLADTSTMPELGLKLQPVSRQYAAAREPLVKRATPLAVGVGGLAAAAALSFLLPIPQVEKPQDTTATPKPSESPSPVASNSPEASPSPTDLETLLGSVPEITDPTQLRFLQRKVYDKIFSKWEPNLKKFNEALIYRVGVGKDGEIIGYKAVNSAANSLADKTPLPELLYLPTTGSVPRQEPIALFKIVFTERGILQISPWRGFSRQPSLGPEIKDDDEVRDLSRKLYKQLRKNWSGVPTYRENLVYRVAVNKEGAIADYEPFNQAAFDYVKETPLHTLSQPVQSNDTAVPKEPLAQFKVVFKPSGVLEVGPYSK
jgi:hypothetical protein